MKIFENIKEIKGIGDKTAKLFGKLGVYTVEDLLHYFPRAYSQYSKPIKLKDAVSGENSAFKLFVVDDFTFKKVRNLTIGQGKLSDGENIAYVTYFNTPYYKKDLIKGNEYIFYGKLNKENGRYKLEQPAFYKESDYNNLLCTLQPLYSLTKGLSNKTVSKAVKSAIEEGEYPFLYDEYLPENIINDFDLIDRKSAIIKQHFPDSFEDLKQCHNRLAFDELFVFLYLMQELKGSNADEKSEYTFIETALPNRLLERLPYKLTNAQLSVLEDIKKDLLSGMVMNRLIQGDVGSGKTIVSFWSLILCADNGYQGAMMAPTEILAIQHYDNLKQLNDEYGLGLNIALLTGTTTVKNKRQIYEQLQNGDINIVIGTHALIQDKVVFKNLGLVVTDEQHRFGVLQRQNLSLKGGRPHVLVMSATPIPRTLAIVLYGDMHLSVIGEKPANRLPVKNCVVGTSYRPKAYEFITKQVIEGRQAYVICPMVEESEGLSNVENVIEYTEKLKRELPSSINIAYLHGQMKPDEKNRIMVAFASKNIDVLVSTTVIEVGIDVPNATVMMIENAERFGLSQLHQLRGRIGRGKHQSYCIFINSDSSSQNNKRLEILNRTNDGFKVAEEDLKLRGSGDLFGIRQSGDLGLKYADIYEDAGLIIRINKLLNDIFSEDTDLALPQNQRMKIYLNENRDKFIDFSSI